MTRIILIYGAIAGTFVITSMLIGFALSDGEGFGSSQLIGYLFMLVALSLIFVGVKRYRDRELGGVIKFGAAALMGLGIGAVAGVMYVAIWEVNLAVTNYAFIDNYTTGIIEAKKAKGLAGVELEALVTKMEKMKEQYGNPLFRLPMTFMEIFPVAAIVSLISALLLRNEKFMPTRA